MELPDAKDVKLNLDPEGNFSFSATSGADSIPYELNLDLFDKVNVNVSVAKTETSLVNLVEMHIFVLLCYFKKNNAHDSVP